MDIRLARIGSGFSGVRYQVMDIESRWRVIVARLFCVNIVTARVETALIEQRKTEVS